MARWLVLVGLAVSACAPDQVGQQVGRSLYDASVDTGHAIATVGDRTGAALQRAGASLRGDSLRGDSLRGDSLRGDGAPVYDTPPLQLPPPSGPDSLGPISAEPLGPPSYTPGYDYRPVGPPQTPPNPTLGY